MRDDAPVKQFGSRFLAIAAASSALLAIMLWLTTASLREVQQTSAWSHHTQEVRIALDAVRLCVLGMESSQRGYLLTGREPYLQPYTAGVAELNRQMTELQRLVADNAAQTSRLSSVRQLIGQRRRQLEYGLRLYAESGNESAETYMLKGDGLVTMASLTAVMGAMSSEEQQLLQLRKQKEQESLQRNFYFSVFLCIGTAVLLFAVFMRVQREVAARTIAMRKMDELNTSLVEATASKTRFLSAASHDLRQPLHSLALLNAALRGQQLSSPARAIVEAQRGSLEAMSNLINRLLNISMIESGVIQPHIEDFALSPMLTALQAEFMPQARAKQLQLEIDATTEAVRTDPTLFREVVQNLLANAIRYTDRGQVWVRARREGESINLEVADTGRGISEDQLERVFEEFYQVRQGGQAPPEGFGLGLSIVRRVTKLLNIQIGVRSIVGQGTTFTLRLERAAATIVSQPELPVVEMPNARQGHILLVDDEASVRNATALFLRMDGHDVRCAAAPDEAFDAASELGEALDVIVTDYQLNATLSGADVVEKLRQRNGREIPAVVLSGDTVKVSPRCASIPNCKVFSKPVDAEELAAHIRKALESAGAAVTS